MDYDQAIGGASGELQPFVMHTELNLWKCCCWVLTLLETVDSILRSAARWKEALDAGCAPPVVLAACHADALKYGISLDDLRTHAI